MQRFFRIADEALYEDVRLALDVSWGHVPPTTCVDPATTAPRDLQGRILLAVRNEFADFEAVSAILPGLLESGAVEEITASAYWAAMPQTEGP
jgi:hypothetical protein